MTALLGGVVAASFLGSLHCVAMCGPLVGLYSAGAGPGRRGWLAHAAYQGGRLATLLLLGLLFGALGTGVGAFADRLGLQRAAAITAGGLMVLAGAWVAAGLRAPGPRQPSGLARVLGAVTRRVASLPPARRALAIGVLTPLLPCGWLYLFYLAAAGAGDPLSGASVMAAFWVGNTPTLLAVGVGLQAGLGRVLRGRSLRLRGAGVALVGLLLLAQRPALSLQALEEERGAAPLSAIPLPADQGGLPCCAE